MDVVDDMEDEFNSIEKGQITVSELGRAFDRLIEPLEVNFNQSNELCLAFGKHGS